MDDARQVPRRRAIRPMLRGEVAWVTQSVTNGIPTEHGNDQSSTIVPTLRVKNGVPKQRLGTITQQRSQVM
ncbi:hypothetical protein C5I_0137090 [Pseudomonas syringae pv. syringae FF5]|nr:hypothetical protein C5I_0137090 [Pseudomonas syringae pv. syringae FF5]